MMFATLDDVEGQVEMLVLGKAFTEAAEFLAVDNIVIVRGRLDHQEQGQTKLVAHEVEHFEPSDDEVTQARTARVPEPVVVRIDAAEFGPGIVDELKIVFENFPGRAEVMLEMETREGMRRLKFGDGYRVQPSAALNAELDAVLGLGARAA